MVSPMLCEINLRVVRLFLPKLREYVPLSGVWVNSFRSEQNSSAHFC